MIQTMERTPSAVVLARLDWEAMDEQPEDEVDVVPAQIARAQFEDQALPFMDQLYGAAMRMTSMVLVVSTRSQSSPV